MKGIILNLVEESVTLAHGEDAWDAVLERAGVNGAYTSLGTYPDVELFAILAAASEELEVDADSFVEWLGVKCGVTLSERFPRFYTAHKTTRTFLATLDTVVHPEVTKTFPHAETPRFEIETRTENVFAMHYRSKRALCRFAAGLALGTAPRFGERAAVTHEACTREGHDHCVLLIELVRNVA